MGAFHVMLIWVEETAFGVRSVGAAGTPGFDEDFGVAEASFDGVLVPIEFTAETRKVY